MEKEIKKAKIESVRKVDVENKMVRDLEYRKYLRLKKKFKDEEEISNHPSIGRYNF